MVSSLFKKNARFCDLSRFMWAVWAVDILSSESDSE